LTTSTSSKSTTVTTTTTSTTTTRAEFGPLGWLRAVIHLADLQEPSAVTLKRLRSVPGAPVYLAGVALAAISATAALVWFSARRFRPRASCKRRDIVSGAKFHVLPNH
jgi:hypothetical protein